MRARWVTHHTSSSTKETPWLRELTASAHRKTVVVSCPQCKEQYEKVLEDVSAYTPRYMEEMESIFEQSQEEERKRISFVKQAFLSIHRHLDVTNNERWAACAVGLAVCTLCLLSSAFFSPAKCESRVQRAPPNPDVHQWARGSEMVEDQPWPGNANRLAEGGGVWSPFPAPKKGAISKQSKNTGNVISDDVFACFMLAYQDWVPPVKKLNRKKRQKRKESRPWVFDKSNFSEWVDFVLDVLFLSLFSEWWSGVWRYEHCMTTLEKKETNCPSVQVTPKSRDLAEIEVDLVILIILNIKHKCIPCSPQGLKLKHQSIKKQSQITFQTMLVKMFINLVVKSFCLPLVDGRAIAQKAPVQPVAFTSLMWN